MLTSQSPLQPAGFLRYLGFVCLFGARYTGVNTPRLPRLVLSFFICMHGPLSDMIPLLCSPTRIPDSLKYALDNDLTLFYS